MSYKTNTDNIYKEGTIITAKEYPDVKLMITKYYHRTYYCIAVDDEEKKTITYFERELISPTKGPSKKQLQ